MERCFRFPRSKLSRCFDQHHGPLFCEIVNEFSRTKMCPIFYSELYLYLQVVSFRKNQVRDLIEYNDSDDTHI